MFADIKISCIFVSQLKTNKMTLREEFENDVKTNKNGIAVLFETSNQHYIEWLEYKIKKLYEAQNKLRDEAVKKLNCMQKVRVC